MEFVAMKDKGPFTYEAYISFRHLPHHINVEMDSYVLEANEKTAC